MLPSTAIGRHSGAGFEQNHVVLDQLIRSQLAQLRVPPDQCPGRREPRQSDDRAVGAPPGPGLDEHYRERHNHDQHTVGTSAEGGEADGDGHQQQHQRLGQRLQELPDEAGRPNRGDEGEDRVQVLPGPVLVDLAPGVVAAHQAEEVAAAGGTQLAAWALVAAFAWLLRRRP